MRHPQNSYSGPAGHVTGTVTGRQESHRNELYHARVRNITYSVFLIILDHLQRTCLYVFAGIQWRFLIRLSDPAAFIMFDISVFRHISDFDLVKVGEKF
jgi:hypothetical protein